MWLLSTDRAELHIFHDPEDIPGGYAIFSHFWEGEEQSFHDIQQLALACAAASAGTTATDIQRPIMSANPRDHASSKIRHACLLSQSYGYNWLWHDTCCINKTSSSELSEAINSMFAYYSLAGICFAYLGDVSSTPILENDTEFRNSRWHKRGWTLQELIAPPVVNFLSRDWAHIGAKHELAPLLESITGIPLALLRSEDELMRYSLAQRMSWAQGRETTRVEDRAYCLLGLFQIHMTTLYGEGRHAFLRLQQKIIKVSYDTSIFAWGLRLTWQSLLNVVATYHHHHVHPMPSLYLFSMTANEFSRAGNIVYDKSCTNTMTIIEVSTVTLQILDPLSLPSQPSVVHNMLQKPTQRGPPKQYSIPTYAKTHYGVICRLPVFEAPSFSVGVLFCSDLDGYIGLLLTRCPDSQDLSRPLYHTGWNVINSLGQFRTIRLVHFGQDLGVLRFNGKPVAFQWKEISLIHQVPLESKPPPRFLDTKNFIPFKLSESAFVALSKHGWEVFPKSQIPHKWTESQTIDLIFQCAGPSGTRIIFAMGRCHRRRDISGPLGAHWASLWAYSSEGTQSEHPPPHSCAEHHITEWPNLQMLFTDPQEKYVLPMTTFFTRCPQYPNKTMIMTGVKFGRGFRFGRSWFSRRRKD